MTIIYVLAFKIISDQKYIMGDDTMVMINTCCQGQGSTDNVNNPVWIEQKNYIATAREAMYDSTCNICLMELFDSD